METKKEIDKMNWIFDEIRRNLEKMRGVQEENPEWNKVAEPEEMWE
jgi:hypothetical protein